MRARREVPRHRFVIKEVWTRSFVQDVTKGIIFTKRSLTDTQEPIKGDEGINFRKSFSDVALVTLDHATSNKKTTEAPRLLEFREFKNAIDALFDCALKEAAGVNNRNVSTTQFVYDLEPRIAKHSNHNLRIDLILGAP